MIFFSSLPAGRSAPLNVTYLDGGNDPKRSDVLSLTYESDNDLEYNDIFAVS